MTYSYKFKIGDIVKHQKTGVRYKITDIPVGAEWLPHYIAELVGEVMKPAALMEKEFTVVEEK